VQEAVVLELVELLVREETVCLVVLVALQVLALVILVMVVLVEPLEI
jgi:hypothetical protein